MFGIIDDCHVLVTAQKDELTYLRASLTGFAVENTITSQTSSTSQSGNDTTRQPQVILSLVEAYYQVAITKRLSITNVRDKDSEKNESKLTNSYLWALFSR